MKIVINKCYGGFGLSHKAFLALREMKNVYALKEPDIGEAYDDGSIRTSISSEKPPTPALSLDAYLYDIPRDDPDLIKVVERLGEECDMRFSRLAIVEIPDGVDWEIEQYDGKEWICEKHRKWC